MFVYDTTHLKLYYQRFLLALFRHLFLTSRLYYITMFLYTMTTIHYSTWQIAFRIFTDALKYAIVPHGRAGGGIIHDQLSNHTCAETVVGSEEPRVHKAVYTCNNQTLGLAVVMMFYEQQETWFSGPSQPSLQM